MEKSSSEYLKVKKNTAIGCLAITSAVLIALITFTVLDHIKLGELEEKINSAATSFQMGPGGHGEFNGGTPPEMNGEMPELPEGEEAPDMNSESNPSGKNSNGRKTKTKETTGNTVENAE